MRFKRNGDDFEVKISDFLEYLKNPKEAEIRIAQIFAVYAMIEEGYSEEEIIETKLCEDKGEYDELKRFYSEYRNQPSFKSLVNKAKKNLPPFLKRR